MHFQKPITGIIPAHAGFTRDDVRSGASYWDHPRTRGVYTCQQELAQRSLGSSPHTRGLPLTNSNSSLRKRIIPAHAGFTGGGCVSLSRVWDHPRTRGVYVGEPGDQGPEQGSSPHTRGLRSGHNNFLPILRIIPAHAGFTQEVRSQAPQYWDHPRTRGVYALTTLSITVLPGSSPHTRGLRGADHVR